MVSKKMVNTPKNNIPIACIVYYDNAEPSIEFKSHRTGKTELLPVSSFMALLIKAATKRPE